MSFILGITGGIGSGKSAATDIFMEYAIESVDADIVAREVVNKQSGALTDIVAHFGETILLPSGELDRPALRERIFKQPEEKIWLEQLLHPLIRQRIQRQLAAITSPYGILSSPLLFETQQDKLVERTLVIDVSETQQQQRASQRDNVSTEAITRIMSTQLNRTERNAKADDIIDNNGSITELRKAIRAYHQQILDLL